MPRVARHRAVATRDTIQNLWAMAERDGECTIRLHSREDCMNVRNKLYAHRSRLQKHAAAHVGVQASHLDNYTFHFEPKEDGWYFTICASPPIEFDLIVPDDMPEEAILHLDTWDDDEYLNPPIDYIPVKIHA